MIKKIKTLLILFSFFPFVVFADYVQLRDMPLEEVAKLTSEKTEYSLVIPSEAKGSISFFKGLDLSPLDFKDFLLGSLRVNGLDYEIKGKQIYVKTEEDQIIFDDYYSRSYTVELDEVDLSSFIDKESRYVSFQKYHLVYTSPKNHRAINQFLNSIKKNDKKKISSSLSFQDFDESLIDSFDFGDDLQLAYDKKQKKIVFYGYQSEVDQAVKVFSRLNRVQKTYDVRFLIATLNRSNIESKGLGFSFQQGGFSLELAQSVLGFSSVASVSQTINAFANFLKSDSTTRIISQPYMQVLDGSTAKIRVGKEVPFVTSTIDQVTGQSIKTVDRKNVGLNLDVSVSAITQSKIALTINQDLSSLSATSVGGDSGVVTDNQSVSTTIHVAPGRFYSFGGLSDQRTKESDSIGLLSFDDSVDHQSQEIAVFVYVSLPDDDGGDSIPSGSSSQINFWWD